ncbi:hypothetical protein CWI37_0494p0020 [Hamiltosporidium tvaerminnensis]|uniref:Uncharacterized protein n=2 Tax=Hamiltosporidium TaxID=1176354 RepID=A0A4Q9L8U7_9MICR|nr:hypothetical protein LUQ84_001342 [Hamiltosporidium tvaerminnensis]TBU02378.1 hypothetical protein CWI37_0494p0020 [Hamiltosporidium tvaerminnensis]TBU03645.1 hypothetical protein CWI39_0933p0020 [Hamiltosporidium magnivora]
MEEFLENYFKDESIEKIKYLYSARIDNKTKISKWYLLILESARKRILNPRNIFVLPSNLSEKFIFKNEVPICVNKVLDYFIEEDNIIHEKNGYFRQICRLFTKDSVFNNKDSDFFVDEDQHTKKNLEGNKNDICKIFQRSMSIQNIKENRIYILKDLVFEWFEIIKKTVDSVIEENYFISRYNHVLNKQELYLLLEILQRYKKIGICKEKELCLILFDKETDTKRKNIAILKSRIFKLKNFIDSNKLQIEKQNFKSNLMNEFVKDRNNVLLQKILQADQFKDSVIEKITNLEQLSIFKKFSQDFPNIKNLYLNYGDGNTHFIDESLFNIDSILSMSNDQENIKNKPTMHYKSSIDLNESKDLKRTDFEQKEKHFNS